MYREIHLYIYIYGCPDAYIHACIRDIGTCIHGLLHEVVLVVLVVVLVVVVVVLLLVVVVEVVV